MPAFGPSEVHPPPLYSELTVCDLSAVADEAWAVCRTSSPGLTLIAHTAGPTPGDTGHTIRSVVHTEGRH
jgi:hypothetical protein